MSSHSAEIPRNSMLGKYKIAQRLGVGAFAQVYKAENTETQEIFAIKVFPKSNLEQEDDVVRFQREIDAMAILKHENVVSMHDFFSDESNFYIVMDYCQNGELMDYIAKNNKIVEPTAALIFEQIVSAIAYCHSFGVAHRDLKPENVLFDKFPHVKVADFGLCGYINPSKLMSTFCGSPCYSAPECLYHHDYDGQKSDIWSLGVILYLMVVGNHPWNVHNINLMMKDIVSCNYKVPKEVSPECKDLIEKILVYEPTQRLSLEQILKHPWIKNAAKAKVFQNTGRKHSLPPLPPVQPKKLQEIADAARASQGESDRGIVAPLSFLSRSGSVTPVTPVRRSTSNSNLVQRASTPKVTSPTVKVGARRQRSVEVFSSKTKVLK